MKRSSRQFSFIGLFILLFCTSGLLRADETAFAEANRFYEQQNFSAAAAAYEKLIESGQVSAPVYFNLGNAYFKADQNGRAIAAYLQAQKLAPRDPDIRANLRLAREQAQVSNPQTGVFISWLNRLTPNEWTLLAAVPFWLCFGLLAFGELRPDWGKIVRAYGFIFAALTIIFAVCLGISASQASIQRAVAISKEATVRQSPFVESKEAFAVREGTELKVLDARENWLQVSDSANRVGWISAPQIQVLK